MTLVQPKVNEDAQLDAWSINATEEINKNEERLNALLSSMEALANGSSVDQLRDAIKTALS